MSSSWVLIWARSNIAFSANVALINVTPSLKYDTSVSVMDESVVTKPSA
jgi:hypothetical protein